MPRSDPQGMPTATYALRQLGKNISLLVIGMVVLIYYGLSLMGALMDLSRLINAPRAEAVVLEVIPGQSTGLEITYQYEARLPNGEPSKFMRTVSQANAESTAIKAGDEIEILYHPLEPAISRLPSEINGNWQMVFNQAVLPLSSLIVLGIVSRDIQPRWRDYQLAHKLDRDGIRVIGTVTDHWIDASSSTEGNGPRKYYVQFVFPAQQNGITETITVYQRIPQKLYYQLDKTSPVEIRYLAENPLISRLECKAQET